MAVILNLFYFFVLVIYLASGLDENQFVYNGFRGANLSMDHLAKINPNGLLQLTNTTAQKTGHAFYQQPLKFNSSNSFSTYFVFAIVRGSNGGHGLAFVISRSKDFSHTDPTQYLGLFNISSNGLSTNHVLAIEFDTVLSAEFDDIDNNHVGIDINNLNSTYYATASYFTGKKEKNITLISGDPIQVWIDYDDAERLLNVTIAPIRTPKPKLALLSSHVNISDIFSDTMYVGFSAATGSLTSDHYILGWSFNTSGKAQTLNYSDLPKLPSRKSKTLLVVKIALPILFVVVLLIAITGAAYLYRRKYRELREEWENAYGPQRFSYKHLYKATKGFSNKELLGSGGFGDVFRGTIGGNQEIAVKRVSHYIEHGMKQFVSEIVCMGRLRHKNLVQLLGYSRRKGELLLVYEYMPNGSLDDFLFSNDKPNLTCNPETTQVVGTPGYLAPELTKTSKATVSSDVFGFGVFLLEVVCGRRPIEYRGLPEERNLIDWVIACWRSNALMDVIDPRLESAYVVEEVELILKLGLLCTHCVPTFRPGMGQVIQYLDDNVNLPDIQPESGMDMLTRAHQTLGFPLSIPSSGDNNCTPLISRTTVITDQAFGLSAASSWEEKYSPLVTSITVSVSSTGR
ncbi:hypothetical protein ACFE04_015119 [Oxalis oulophora]